MADTGVKYPATVSTIQETGDDNDWTTPAEVVSDNGVYGEITAASFDANDLSYLLRATNPSMGVPAGATINGILVEIERHYANGTVADEDVCLTKDGSARVGDDKSTAAAFPTADAITSFGGATDLWGTTWTADEINAATFGVLYKMKATGANADGFVDFIRITVYYTPGLTAVGDTVQAIFHVRQAVNDVLAPIWHVRSLVSKTVQPIWNVRAALGDIAQPIWHVRAAVGDTINVKWNVLTFIGKSMQAIFNVATFVGKSAQYIWHVRAAPGKAIQALWNVKAVIGDTIQARWNVLTMIGDPVQIIFHVRQAVGDTAQLVFHVRQAVNDTVQAVWHIRSVAGDTVNAKWNVLVSVG